ncbi:TniQ [mine drainage metagenome]|uniref:TniQ n=1 Tax=mine drainage metagenome TaxID=410659 RepID=A0A1J5R7W4_9ZZZZ
MTNAAQLWLYHPKPLPDELLTSWLTRIAHGHGMKLQTFCRVALGKGQELWLRDVDRQAPDWLMRALSVHTGVGLRAIRRASLLDYKGVLYRRYKWSGYQFWLLPLKMVDTSYQHHGMQYCPLCLAEDEVPYFRKRWRVAFYTMCTKHQCMVHDRCPTCGAAVEFHRREMGKFSQVDAGLITQCHVCDFDLRKSSAVKPAIYDESAYLKWLPALRMLEGDGVDSRYNVGLFAVLHQLCKIMLTHYQHVHLRQYVSDKIGAPEIALHPRHEPFEHYSLEARHVVIQLAMWLLADPETRIVDAWRNKAVRYNVLNKDFKPRPKWYRDIVAQCADWRKSTIKQSQKSHSKD